MKGIYYPAYRVVKYLSRYGSRNSFTVLMRAM